MISIKSEAEIELMRKAGQINYLCHQYLSKHIKPGITTKHLDQIAYEFIISHDGYPSFKGYEGFPGSICTSVNEEVVHGIPSNRILKENDIISIDIGVIYKGYHSDSAWTYPVGEISALKQKLLADTKESLYRGLKEIKNGVQLTNVSQAIENYANESGLAVVQELVGHGVGKNLHEEPDVPNYGKSDVILKSGMTIAVEPMLNLGTRKIYLLEDNWTIITRDGKPSAHFEHTVLVTDNGYEILTGE